MNKKKLLFDLLILFIISIPTFVSLLNNQYFAMHDDQHVARLFLLDQGIKQGVVYPRWVDHLGFGYGYPLFNFYPPLIYYLGEFFHLLGFSYFWSVKLVFILGFFLAGLGMYLLTRKKIGRLPALLAATIYNYFFYHAVNSYVRGALAEFFSMALLPFVFLAFDNLAEKLTLKNAIFLGISIGLLIICHPLIAFPATFYLLFFAVYYFLKTKKVDFIVKLVFSGLIGLGISAFFWLPSIVERKYTLVDSILTKELASYKIHYVYLSQFWYSLWGYGGSTAGPYDGMTFQLGKINIFLVLSSLLISIFFWIKSINKEKLSYFYFSFCLLIFSLLMTTNFSSFVWDRVSYLWYLQFPWRFLTFTDLFISVCAGYFAWFLLNLFSKKKTMKFISKGLIILFILSVITIYHKYFQPQKMLTVTDSQLTSNQEISWRISRTSFEFVPKGVATKKSELETTILDIDKNNLPKQIYQINKGQAKVEILENKFANKAFRIDLASGAEFQLNTFYFPGWQAYLDDKKIEVSSANRLRLITVSLPPGIHELNFKFKDTLIRTISNTISIAVVFFLLAWLVFIKRIFRE